MADILQFIPRPNPQRDAKAVEIKNVRKIMSTGAPDPTIRTADDPSEYAMNDDTAPAEYVAPDQDGA